MLRLLKFWILQAFLTCKDNNKNPCLILAKTLFMLVDSRLLHLMCASAILMSLMAPEFHSYSNLIFLYVCHVDPTSL